MTGVQRTPDDIRWIRSGNEMLHAVHTGPPRPETTACGLVMRRINWSNHVGPRVTRDSLARGRYPMCLRCSELVEWEEDESGVANPHIEAEERLKRAQRGLPT